MNGLNIGVGGQRDGIPLGRRRGVIPFPLPLHRRGAEEESRASWHDL